LAAPMLPANRGSGRPSAGRMRASTRVWGRSAASPRSTAGRRPPIGWRMRLLPDHLPHLVDAVGHDRIQEKRASAALKRCRPVVAEAMARPAPVGSRKEPCARNRLARERCVWGGQSLVSLQTAWNQPRVFVREVSPRSCPIGRGADKRAGGSASRIDTALTGRLVDKAHTISD
jgi:hypothetical protein